MQLPPPSGSLPTTRLPPLPPARPPLWAAAGLKRGPAAGQAPPVSAAVLQPAPALPLQSRRDGAAPGVNAAALARSPAWPGARCGDAEHARPGAGAAAPGALAASVPQPSPPPPLPPPSPPLLGPLPRGRLCGCNAARPPPPGLHARSAPARLFASHALTLAGSSAGAAPRSAPGSEHPGGPGPPDALAAPAAASLATAPDCWPQPPPWPGPPAGAPAGGARAGGPPGAGSAGAAGARVGVGS